MGRGVAIRAGLTGDERFHASLAAWATALPAGAAFTGLTAARLHGLWLPPLRADDPIEVATLDTGSHIRHSALRVTRHPTSLSTVSHGALQISSVPETLLACARELDVLDLVVLTDAALQLGHCTASDVEVVAARRRRGAPRLRRALGLTDSRSESAWESLLRVLHVSADLPVEPQAEVRDEDGRFLARADLLVTGTRTLQEYDGDVHLERGQYRRDRRRDSALAKAGFVRHGWNARQVLHDGWSIAREAAQACGRALRPCDLRPWFALLHSSRFSPAAETGQLWQRPGA